MKTDLSAPGTPGRIDVPLPAEQLEQRPVLPGGGDYDGGREVAGSRGSVGRFSERQARLFLLSLLLKARRKTRRLAWHREQRPVRRMRKPDLRRRYQDEHDERTRNMAARLHSGLH